jgi:RNA polymerase sigma factor (sigma-70 family)
MAYYCLDGFIFPFYDNLPQKKWDYILKGIDHMTRVEEMVALVQKAQQGDAEAYAEIVHRFQDMAYGYAFTYLNNFHLAQDAAQEAFIEAYACLPTLREPRAFPAWLKRIVFKHCDRLTRQKRHPTTSLESINEVPSPNPGPDDILQRNEAGNQVQSAIQGLPFNERVVTTLYYINGYSQQEIANFLDLPTQTIKSRLHDSRQRLKERMLNMVQDELKANPLPEGFTAQTLEQAIAQAGKLNQERRFDDAEELLHKVLAESPEHPLALKELNRTLMWGGVYGQGRWDLLPELVRQGKLILKHSDDETVHQELGKTLLAVPVMPEAVAFIESWIEQKGANMERLGMLAWAKGCAGDLKAAQEIWVKMISLAEQSSPEVVLKFVPFAAYTLVDCLSEADNLPGAQKVAQDAWELCHNLGSLPEGGELNGDAGWLMIFHQAKLEYRENAKTLLQRYQNLADPKAKAATLHLQAWANEPKDFMPSWLAWIQHQIVSEDWAQIEQNRMAILGALRKRGYWAEANQLAEDVWELLGKSTTAEAEQARLPWDWERFNSWGAIQSQAWEAAETISRQERQARGLQAAGPWAIVIAAGHGTPTPPELVQAVEEHGISSVDEYGLFGWYLVAREAAPAGNEAKAFDALRKALAYWSNSPYGYDKIWEKDKRWGKLREHPAFERIFAEKRQRIGPIFGLLHYFPGW